MNQTVNQKQLLPLIASAIVMAASIESQTATAAATKTVMLENFEAYANDQQLAKAWYRPPHGGGVYYLDDIKGVHLEGLDAVRKDKAETRDVFPVFTERSFASIWQPATGFNPFFKDSNRSRPFAELTASFHIFGGAENMGENERGRIDPRFSGSPEVAVPEGKVCLRFSALTKGATAGMTLKDLKLPNQDPTGEKRGWRGSTPFEEYIADFSTYKDVGKFHFRYWARKGERFKVQAKVQGIEVVGTGQWESAIIEPLHKELHTHHILIMFQNLNDGPAELYLDDAFYYKGDLPDALIRAREAGRSDAAPAEAAKPRTIVTTDIETDDYSSLIRYLAYASDFETVGLVYGSSEFHWAGDGKGTTFFLPRRPYSTPQTSWRWTGVHIGVKWPEIQANDISRRPS